MNSKAFVNQYAQEIVRMDVLRAACLEGWKDSFNLEKPIKMLY